MKSLRIGFGIEEGVDKIEVTKVIYSWDEFNALKKAHNPESIAVFRLAKSLELNHDFCHDVIQIRQTFGIPVNGYNYLEEKVDFISEEEIRLVAQLRKGNKEALKRLLDLSKGNPIRDARTAFRSIISKLNIHESDLSNEYIFDLFIEYNLLTSYLQNVEFKYSSETELEYINYSNSFVLSMHTQMSKVSFLQALSKEWDRKIYSLNSNIPKPNYPSISPRDLEIVTLRLNEGMKYGQILAELGKKYPETYTLDESIIRKAYQRAKSRIDDLYKTS